LKVRPATAGDIPRLVAMGREFHEAVQPAWPWSADGFASLIALLTCVSISGGGFLAGTKGPWPFNPDWIVAHEILWWATDGSGAAHIRAFRQWAADANEIKWSCRADNARVIGFYSKFSTASEAVFSEVAPCA